MGIPGGSAVKNPPAKESQVQSLGEEDPLEKEIAIHSSILTWEIPWQAIVFWGLKRVRHDLATKQQWRDFRWHKMCTVISSIICQHGSIWWEKGDSQELPCGPSVVASYSELSHICILQLITRADGVLWLSKTVLCLPLSWNPSQNQDSVSKEQMEWILGRKAITPCTECRQTYPQTHFHTFTNHLCIDAYLSHTYTIFLNICPNI